MADEGSGKRKRQVGARSDLIQEIKTYIINESMSFLDEILGLDSVHDKSDQIVITRKELYEKIWSMPTTHLAKELHISDVAIAKICKNLNVPKPPLGYWQKVRLGRHPRQLPLPEIQPGEPTEATITPSDRRNQYTRSDELLMRIAKESEPGSRIKVASKLDNPHPLTRFTRDLFQNSREDNYCRLQKRGHEPCLEIQVSKAMLNRALRIMDALIKALVSRGQKVETTNEGQFSTKFIIERTAVNVRLVEKIDRAENVGSEAEKSSWDWKRFSFKPAGELFFEIDNYRARGCRKKWFDSPRSPLEDQLNDIIIGLYDVAEASHNAVLQREKEVEQQRIKETQRLIAEREKAAESERLATLEKQCDLWVKSQNLRLFIQAYEDHLTKQSGSIDPGGPEAKWLDWARKYADEIDPLGSISLEKLTEDGSKLT